MDLEITSSISDGTDSFHKKMSLSTGLIGIREIELMDAGVVCPSPIPLRLNTFNQAFADVAPKSESDAKVLEVPVAIHGIIRETAEVDSFHFAVHQTGMIALEVFASRLGSRLDSLVEVQDQSGPHSL